MKFSKRINKYNDIRALSTKLFLKIYFNQIHKINKRSIYKQSLYSSLHSYLKNSKNTRKTCLELIDTTYGGSVKIYNEL